MLHITAICPRLNTHQSCRVLGEARSSDPAAGGVCSAAAAAAAALPLPLPSPLPPLPLPPLPLPALADGGAAPAGAPLSTAGTENRSERRKTIRWLAIRPATRLSITSRCSCMLSRRSVTKPAVCRGSFEAVGEGCVWAVLCLTGAVGQGHADWLRFNCNWGRPPGPTLPSTFSSPPMPYPTLQPSTARRPPSPPAALSTRSRPICDPRRHFAPSPHPPSPHPLLPPMSALPAAATPPKHQLLIHLNV